MHISKREAEAEAVRIATEFVASNLPRQPRFGQEDGDVGGMGAGGGGQGGRGLDGFRSCRGVARRSLSDPRQPVQKVADGAVRPFGLRLRRYRK